MALRAEMKQSHDIICDIWRGNDPVFALLCLGGAAHAPSPAMELCCCPQVQRGAAVLLACRKCALFHAESHGLQKRAAWA